VNAVAPGPTLPSPQQREADFVKHAESLPLRRGPLPEDIAAAWSISRADERDRRHDRSMAASILPGALPTATYIE
jgi:hypothetical protein